MSPLPVTPLSCVGFLAGYVFGPGIPTTAQAQGAGQVATLTHPTEGIFWSAETLQQGHADLVARAASGQTGGGNVSPVRTRTPSLSMTLLHRPFFGEPRMSRNLQIMSEWADAEAHEGNYDFYVIAGGTGSVVVGGDLENEVRVNGFNVPGELRGQPISNGTEYRVKAGDWLLIPPNVAHWPKPDPGGMTYLRMVVYTYPRS